MSLIGVLFAVLVILGGNMIEGGHPSALLDLPAFMIVIGGTIGAAMTQFPFSVIGASMKRFKWLISPLRTDLRAQSELLQELAGNARRNGMLALEGMLDQIQDPFLRKGIQMMVDGYEKEKIHEVLENEIEFEHEDIEQTVKFYEAMGGYCPTMGIVGAVFGLIHAMGLLDAPDKLGGAIAVAFIATIYGVSAANLIFLPFGNRYKAFAHQIRHYKEMTLTGIMCIMDGESQQRLQISLSPYTGEDGNEKEKG
ncbi:flagellar motor protein [Aeromonas simiae]|uniref:Flagellar motor protein n=1 Tax=Aeromonas simiae TaxID=218936 RepID=A0A5J6WS13_9GAMM|nr:flagellar motor protein [Aeromonas simiae]MDO2949214.1 flagellar motor protein [Aeromonas simiae]MDO2951196.1 flagellar motor protein [Aeromonas simiae]MDO2956432.1 flagellar motor protein [Aeromonas simiae]QFI53702.1 flagellar motor protein [Aeromonas simiae]